MVNKKFLPKKIELNSAYDGFILNIKYSGNEVKSFTVEDFHSGEIVTTSFKYDNKKRLIETTDKYGVTKFKYDSLNKLISEKLCISKKSVLRQLNRLNFTQKNKKSNCDLSFESVFIYKGDEIVSREFIETDNGNVYNEKYKYSYNSSKSLISTKDSAGTKTDYYFSTYYHYFKDINLPISEVTDNLPFENLISLINIDLNESQSVKVVSSTENYPTEIDIIEEGFTSKLIITY